MTGFRIFGDCESLAIVKPAPKLSPLSVATNYTKPSLEIFFSHYGFAYPLTPNTVPFHVLADDEFPVHSDVLRANHPLRRYVLVDHQGRVWKVIIQPDQNNELTIGYTPVCLQSGWWMTDGGSGDEPNADRDILLGFLYTEPSRAEINAYWSKQNKGEDLLWFSLLEIVVKLNSQYPQKPKPPKLTKDMMVVKGAVMAVVDNVIREKMGGESAKQEYPLFT
jgi:hypothetical protein